MDPYFKEKYKLMAVNLRKQQTLNANLKAMQHINFNKILPGHTIMFLMLSIIE